MPRKGGVPANLKPGYNPKAHRPKGSKNKLTIARVEQELRHIALMDPLGLFERVHGHRRTFRLSEISAMAPEVRACIASVKVRTENLTAGDDKQDTTVEIRLWDKIRALELCAKHFGWAKDTVVIEGNVADILQQRHMKHAFPRDDEKQ